jgi:membrane-associated phospholipid phosphatase
MVAKPPGSRRATTATDSSSSSSSSSSSIHPTEYSVVEAMRALIAPLVCWNAVHRVQLLRCAFLDAWFSYFPLMGNEPQFVLVLTLLACYSDVDGSALRHFVAIAWVVTWANNGAKDLLRLPRPPSKLHVSVTMIDGADHVTQQFGFPSTHSAHALSLAWAMARDAVRQGWGGLAPHTCWWLAAAHVAHICLSRLYLGVHAGIDIAGGLAVAAITVGVWSAFGDFIDGLCVGSNTAKVSTRIFMLHGR